MRRHRPALRSRLALAAALALLVTALGAGLLSAPAPATAQHAAPEYVISPAADTYEPAVLRHLNRVRRRHHLAPLRLSRCVDQFAEARSRRMAVRNEMVHYSGLRRVFRRCGGTRVGENIAAGGFSPANVVRAWMSSPSHRAIILTPSYRQAAVGAWWISEGAIFISLVVRAP